MYCLGCGYNLRGNSTGKCPECGRAYDAADPSTYLTPSAKRWMVKACAVFNIVAGVLAVLGSLIPVAMLFSFGGGAEDLLPFAALPISGLLYAFSGVLLWRYSIAASRKSLLFQGLAIGLALLYCVAFWISIPSGQRSFQDEEIRLFFFLPLALAFLVSIEFVLLWKVDS